MKSCPFSADHVYHATSTPGLKRIRRTGLVPRTQPDCHAGEDRCTTAAVVFFATKPDNAAVWGKHVLRFPHPDDWHEDAYSGGTVLPNGRAAASQGYTRDAIPPQKIDICTNGRWRRLY